MQFWRDAVSHALERRPPKEPVAVLLAHAAASTDPSGSRRPNLSKGFLTRIIDERDKRLHNPPYPDLAALETYAENTYSALLYLTLQGLGIRTSTAADHVASHIGKAQGIAAVLRGLPLLAFPAPPNKHANQSAFGGVGDGGPRGAVMLPLDVMAGCGVREEDVLRRGAGAAGLRDAVFEVATRASDHLITARGMVGNLRGGEGVGHEFEHAGDMEREGWGVEGEGDDAASHSVGSNQNGRDLRDVERAFGVYMPAVATQLWLDRLQKCDFDVFDPALRSADWRLPVRAWWAFRRRVF